MAGPTAPTPAAAVPDDRFEWVEVAGRAELRNWLLAHHRQPEAIWLITFRKGDTERYIPHDIVLDELVSFGWIDGIRRAMDQQRTRQLISPRRTQPWAKSYKDRAERLISAGTIHASGIATVAHARQSGMWDAMNDVDALIVPDDLKAVLLANQPASTHFDAFPPSTRRNILRWIASAKTAPTREKRIALASAEAVHNRRVKSNG